MIPVLRSIDGLLNRFDELSQRHSNFISNFDSNFSDIENPLRGVARDEEEQRKTAENLSMVTIGNDDQIGSSTTVDEFNRRITKSRNNNRPPSYSSNDSISFLHRVPSRSSWATTASAPLPHTSIYPMTPATIKTSTSRPVASTSLDGLIETKVKLMARIKPKFVPQNPPNIRRSARSAITTFTMETVNRLSKPKTYHRSSDQKSHVYRRAKPYQHMNKETSSPQIKRTIPTIIKSSPKKLKVDNKISFENSKRIPMSNYPRPVVFLAPPPVICLTFPMQPELQSSRVVVIPKTTTTTTKKTTGIFTNKKSITLSNRLMYLIT